MAQFILNHADVFIVLGQVFIAGAVVAGVLAATWALEDLSARFRATLDDRSDEAADVYGAVEGGSLHNDSAGGA
jgi:hypothetical protein